MIATIVEGKVTEKNWSKLKSDYHQQTDKLPEGLTRTFLMQDNLDKNIWRIISFWESREVLEKMRNSGKKPAAIQMFESVHSKPELSISEIVQEK